MRFIKFLLAGIIFGIIMTKAEIVSWFRIYEMFRFESFHMYGIIGSAVILGVLIVFFIKKVKLHDIQKTPIAFTPKKMGWIRYLLGGSIFGLGWALSGACPGPMFVLVGMGYLPILIVILGSIVGTFIYGLVRDKLPH